MGNLRSRDGFTLIELMCVVTITGLLAAVAVPSWIRFEARLKQSEPKANLRMLFAAQRAYFSEQDTYSPFVTEIGFVPERGNRYAIANGGPIASWSPRVSSEEQLDGATRGFQADRFKGYFPPRALDVTNIIVTESVLGGGACTPQAGVGCIALGHGGAFLALAAANIDRDATVDTWCVTSMATWIKPNDEKGAEADLQRNGPGLPSNNINDAR